MQLAHEHELMRRKAQQNHNMYGHVVEDDECARKLRHQYPLGRIRHLCIAANDARHSYPDVGS